ncbi:MAG: OB-fold domain-containing protein [Jatrophihabitans sp.]|uniref:OB-fold domain-containing protein n=1 Tax=Jatrophihabitans sp. TaxID=1932789 RepID=UPI003F7FBD3B
MTDILEVAAGIRARGECAPRTGRDPINQPMINNWVEALGVTDPRFRDGVAPPAMIQVWTMGGLLIPRASDDPLGLMMNLLDDAGFTSVVATNCEQIYHRLLRVGEQVTVATRLGDVVGPKRTALGEGWFVTTHLTWYVGDEPVAEMLFRVLKFRPGTGAPPPVSRADTIRPVISQDTAFFWEGTAAGELRIQHCPACDRLRHPPGPLCPACGADKQDWVVAAGTGTVFSFVVHHHPAVPGKQRPFVVALVELSEGVRMLGELVDVDPAAVHIGMPVELALTRIDDELTLPLWRPAGAAQPQQQTPAAVEQRGEQLPELVVEATPTFIVATALATRDFQDVHHDRDAAIRRGSKDIFVNILTDTGLVQRFVGTWAGPDAVIERIAIRLGVPCYAYDTLTFRGEVIARDGDRCTVAVTARGALGDHIVGTVELSSCPRRQSSTGPETDRSGGQAG